ncbi:hypothetical protein Efla_002095 [Eimeria flavescens]
MNLPSSSCSPPLSLRVFGDPHVEGVSAKGGHIAAAAAAAARTATEAAATLRLHAGSDLNRQPSLELPLSEHRQQLMGPLRGPPSFPLQFAASPLTASAPPPSFPDNIPDTEQGANAGGAPAEGPPLEGAPSLSGDFELPLLLLQPSRPSLEAPEGASPAGREEWRQEVSASVAAAFRDLQNNMHLRSNNSRAMRMGLGDLLLQDSNPQGPADRGGALFSHSDSLQGLQAGEKLPIHLNAEEGPPQEARGGPEDAAGARGGPQWRQEATGEPDEEAQEGSPFPEGKSSKREAPCGSPSFRQESQGPRATCLREGAASVEEGSPSSALEIQNEFLSAYNIPPQQAAGIVEAAEAAEAAGDDAFLNRKAAALPRTGSASSSSTLSWGRLIGERGRGPPQQTHDEALPAELRVGGPPQPAPSFSESEWARGLFKRQTSQASSVKNAGGHLESSSTSLSERGLGRGAIDCDRANVANVFPVAVRGHSQKNQQALSPVWCLREVETGDRAALWSATISPKGEWLAAAGQTGVVFLWSIPGPRGARCSQGAPPAPQGGPRPQGAPAAQGPPAHPGPRGETAKQKFNSKGAAQPEGNPKGGPSSCTSLQGGPPVGQLSSTGSASLEGLVEAAVAGVAPGAPGTPRRASVAPSAAGWGGPCGGGAPRSGWFLGDRPDLCLTGHGASVIFLSWAPTTKMSLLLSASLDKTVRLWRPSKGVAAIAVLRCTDWPTCASFHPIFKDVIFTGCLDATIQVWRLLSSRAPGTPGAPRGALEQFDSRIVEYLKVPELVTALSISPNGGVLAVGFRNGSISFYDARTLKFRSEVDCKNRKGKFAKGRKVTSLEWLPDGSSLCVATNDSRIRIFDSLTCIYKFKGHVNSQIMLRASYTLGGLGVVCGSEFGRICYWKVSGPGGDSFYEKAPLAHWRRVTNTAFEDFKAFDELLTFALVAPRPFAESLYSYLSIHPLPARGPPPSRGPPRAPRGPPLQLPPSQQHQVQQLQLLQQQQQNDHSPVGTVRVYGDSTGQVITSISGGPGPGGPSLPTAASKRSRIRSMLSLKRSSPPIAARGGLQGAPQAGPPRAAKSSPKGGPHQSPQGGSQPSPLCSSETAGGGPPKAAEAARAPASPAAAAGAHSDTSSSTTGAAGAVAAVAAAAAAAAEAAAAAAAVGCPQDEAGGLCDSDDSDWCAASLAALSVMESAAGGGPPGARGPKGSPPEGRPLSWRAGKRLHLGLPPDSYAICKQPSEAAHLVVVAGSYNGKGLRACSVRL